jgi:membrane associated rhomboid family serine protease
MIFFAWSSFKSYDYKKTGLPDIKVAPWQGLDCSFLGAGLMHLVGCMAFL